MASSQHLPSGTLLMGGKYKVGHILGQGTFGITYMAVTKTVITGNLGRGEMEVPVAIKEFFLHDFNRRETSTPNVTGTDSELFTVYRRKFRKEALHITELSHPGIIRVFDVFDENGTTYYAMEFVDGENLGDYISRKGSLTVDEAVEAMTEIGAALDYMHSKKMLHLDIKPRNIMRKSDGTFRLIDFGLSKSFDATGFSESSSNIGLGTPGYAPIEQSSGRKDGSFPVTIDVYALGATLFKMLTGECPPKSDEILNDGLPEEALIKKGIPTEIIEVVRKAMSPTVVQRYRSVSALVSDLQKAFLVFTESYYNNEVKVVDVDMQPVNIDLKAVDVDMPLVNVDLQPVNIDLQPVDVELEPVNIDLKPTDEDKERIVGYPDKIEQRHSSGNETSKPPLMGTKTEYNGRLSSSQPRRTVRRPTQQDKKRADSPKTAKKRKGLITLIIILLTAGIFAAILFFAIKQTSDKNDVDPETDITSNTENKSDSQTDPINQIDGEDPEELIDPASETGQTDATDTAESEMEEEEENADQPSDKTETKVTGPAEITQNKITYSLNWSNKTATAKRASRDIKTANIPSEINCNGVNFKVMEIGKQAFYYCGNLTSVKIPDGVTKIGEEAFRGCDSLTSVTIPNSVREIGGSAFKSCSNLTSVIIQNGVTKIGSGAFFCCSNLTSVTIPNSVKEIGGSAFESCSNLTSVTIQNGVTKIGDYAFMDCTNLTSVKIPESVTKIGAWAFSGCNKLTQINVDSRNRFFSSIDGVLYSKDKTKIIRYPGGKNGAFNIPTGVTKIEPNAFSWCRNLTSVTIPNSVTEIGPSAFYECKNLTSVKIPESVTKIGAWAFDGCSNLTSVTIPNSVTVIEERAFFGCSNLTSVKIPDGVTKIEPLAFAGCSNLTSVDIPNSVTEIGMGAFWGCSNLKSVNIPTSVTKIGDHTFRDCSNLTSVTIPNSVTEIGGFAFQCCENLTSVDIPNSVTEIGYCAFEDCTKLDVTYPASAKIGGGAFAGCRSAKPRD